MTIAELQQQKRWVCWKREVVKGKETKVPYQPNGKRAMSNNPATWNTYADCAAVSQLVGIVLGDGIVGVDFDKCCDAFEGKFTPSSREMVIGLDSYGEYSPNGFGAHVLLVADMPGDGKPIVRPGPDFKQIEIKGSGFYFTFSGRHLSKTPHELMPRQEQLTALCKRVQSVVPSSCGMVIPAGNEAEKYRKLMAGDLSDYNGDHSRADLALCSILARKHNNDIFKIDDAFRQSPLYREKWERTDYRSATLLKACKGEPIFDTTEEAPIEDDGRDEYVVDKLTDDHEGWFPLGDQSVVAGMSGVGKTYWAMTVLEKARVGAEVWGHTTTARDYRVLMLDRGARAMRRTLDRLGVSTEARKRVIRVTGAQCALGPVAVLTELVESNPGVPVWFVEGLDLWIPDSNKMNVVGPILDDLQRLAARRFVSLIYSVGSGKEKVMEGRDTERYHGRDVLFGSVAWGRKSETIVVISKTDLEDGKAPRQYSVMVRNGDDERFWLAFQDGELRVVPRPETKETGDKKHKAFRLVRLNVFATFKPGQRILYSESLGVSKSTYYDWLKYAVETGIVDRRDGGYWIPQVIPTPTVANSTTNS